MCYGELILIKESRIKEKPQNSDLIETIELLNDFRIKIKIPEFQTLGQLLKWRSTILDNHLK